MTDGAASICEMLGYSVLFQIIYFLVSGIFFVPLIYLTHNLGLKSWGWRWLSFLLAVPPLVLGAILEFDAIRISKCSHGTLAALGMLFKMTVPIALIYYLILRKIITFSMGKLLHFSVRALDHKLTQVQLRQPSVEIAHEFRKRMAPLPLLVAIFAILSFEFKENLARSLRQITGSRTCSSAVGLSLENCPWISALPFLSNAWMAAAAHGLLVASFLFLLASRYLSSIIQYTALFVFAISITLLGWFYLALLISPSIGN